MKRHKLEKGDFAIKQGDSGDLFYVIQSGELEVIVNTVVVGSLKSGDHFGELALIYDGTKTQHLLIFMVTIHITRRCVQPPALLRSQLRVIPFSGHSTAMNSEW